MPYIVIHGTHNDVQDDHEEEEEKQEVESSFFS